MGPVPASVVALNGRRVRVRPFALDLSPVTNADWRLFCETTGHNSPPWMFKRGFEHPEQPVVGVTAAEARAYARWAGKRLPTEAEWLAACGPARYPWGDLAPTNARACFGCDPRRARSGPAAPERTGLNADTGQPHRPAGAGPHGHLDLVGLVWEHLEAGPQTVARGGFWGVPDPHRDLRLVIHPHDRTAGLGLRCAR
jgi:formylglycine-generating enzyme required for sulfatase activity